MSRAALYLRSSKDRSDVSIDAQRRELQALAADRGLWIVEEYTDVVESAKSEDRPGFQRLLRDLKSSARRWDTLILLDTSRLSRRRYVAQAFKHEAGKRGVTIVYAKVPETDPVSTVILESVFEAMDEVHSLLSREKGLAGMRENIMRGWRAGGRAPRGYRLRRIETGAQRDGNAVTKSVLEPDEESHRVARYLRARAAGEPRGRARRDAGLDAAASTLIGMEWNALTYAGHTVWNAHNEHARGEGYRGKGKRRPRGEWVIQENTHPALISAEEAERLVSRLEHSDIGRLVSEGRSGASDYLLTGLLVAPDGRAWTGYRRRQYRLKADNGRRGRYVDMAPLDEAVTGQLLDDLRSPAFVRALTQEARAQSETEDPAEDLRADLAAATAQVERATSLAMELTDPSPMLRKVDELEARRRSLEDEIRHVDRERSARSALAGITEHQVRALLQGLAEDLAEHPRAKLLLRTFIDRVELDPEALTCQIHYRVSVDDSLSVASPRGRDGWAALTAASRRWRVA